MTITVLAGGFGGARFLRGLRHLLPDEDIVAVVNTGDDLVLHGLQICPDLDTVMYTLGKAIDPERGWGRTGETWRIRDELTAYGAEGSWFGLGDLDIATHLMRTRMLDAGYPLSAVTQALCERWQPGVRLLPMTDERCETHVVVEIDGAPKAIHFQEWWVRYQAKLPAKSFVQVGIADARPAPGVVEAIAESRAILVAPSNPIVSVGPIVSVPGMYEALTSTSAKIVGFSPIIGEAPLRGMADACLSALNVPVTAEGVGRLHGARSEGGLLDGWLVHTGDHADIPGVTVRSIPLLMHDDDATAEMARAALELAGV